MEFRKDFNQEDKFIMIYIYRNPLFKGCGGISEDLDSIYIPCEHGPIRYKDIEFKDQIFLEQKKSEDYYALVPIRTTGRGLVGPMAGGSLAYSSDSRVSKVYHIHDRFETIQQYASYND